MLKDRWASGDDTSMCIDHVFVNDDEDTMKSDVGVIHANINDNAMAEVSLRVHESVVGEVVEPAPT